MTPDEARENYPSLVEYATFNQRWVKYNDKDFSFLEVVEIAYFGKTHMIPPDVTVAQYEASFKALIQKYNETTEEIEGFPSIVEWSSGTMDTFFHNRQLTSAQNKAVGFMVVIYEKQQDIVKKAHWKQENIARQEAQQSALTYEEWLSIPNFAANISKKSWATGRLLPPGNYTTTVVESSKDPYYRKLMRLQHTIRDKFKQSEFKEPPSANEKDNEGGELFIKCSVCGKEGPETEMDHLYMHHSHKTNFWAWSSRVRSKEGTNDPEKPPVAVADLTIKRKYNSLLQTIQKWSEAPDSESLDIMKKMRGLVKRRKIGESEWIGDSPESTPINT